MKKIILFLCLTFVFIFSISCQEEIVDNKVSFFFEEFSNRVSDAEKKRPRFSL